MLDSQHFFYVVTKEQQETGKRTIASCGLRCSLLFGRIWIHLTSQHNQLQSLLDKLFSIRMQIKSEKVN